MQASQLELHRVNLHILSPIHVGTGQEIDPFSYVIRDNSLLLIDLIKWMEDYPEKDELHRLMDSDNFAEIRTFIAENIDPEGFIIGNIPVDSAGLTRTYDRVIAARDPRNQLLIDAMTRNEVSQAAYLPGSSIKGAIRTAIANHFVEPARVTSKNVKRTYKPVFEPDYNEKIFGRIDKDPMRNMKLSDVSLDKFGTLIVEAEEYPLNQDKSLTPKGYKEVSASLCHTGEKVVYPLRFSLSPFSLHGQEVDLSFVIDAMYRFYVPKYKEEYEKFFSSNRANKIRQGIAPMSLEIANLKKNETLIRIGHFSHVECITFDNVREPKTRIVRGRPMPYGTTRTLANGLYPFGWAKLEFVDQNSEPREKRDWPFSIQGVEGLVAAKQEAAQKLKMEEKKAELQYKEEEKKRKAEEKRQAELEAMSPEEREIAEIADPSVSENRVVEIYNKIDEFSEENRKALALALKKYWEVHGKWKKGTKKQRLKVRKIKDILGEM